MIKIYKQKWKKVISKNYKDYWTKSISHMSKSSNFNQLKIKEE